MSEEKSGLNRRKFLECVTAGAIGAGVGSVGLRNASAAQPEASKLERRNEQSGMVYTPFGKTNLNVSRLSYGCIQLTADRISVLEEAVERGVNLVHISNGYVRGQAIQNLGRFLKKPGNRDKVWIMVKGEHGKGLVANIDDQLKIMNTDHVDIVCSPVFDPDRIKNSEDERDKFEALKKAGKARYLNLTTHKSLQEGMEAGLETEWFSTILSVIDLTNVGKFRTTLQRAKEKNVGVMAMKTVRGGGRGKPDNADEIASTLFGARVTTILRTVNTRDQLNTWFAAVQKHGKATAMVAPPCDPRPDKGLCTLCGLCEDCPNGVAIQDIVRDYTYYYKQQGLRSIAAEHYAEILPGEKFPACGDCGRCEEICPMDVPVRRMIREAHARLSETG